uniref:Ribosome binding protein 1 n=1 Tax=Molossus molossus TaxID=27622 RepID=A0A7J8HJ46_MOLMO|nr:ribosome binding protein 1 [Molossus molossus]
MVRGHSSWPEAGKGSHTRSSQKVEPPGLSLPGSPGLPRGSFIRFPKYICGVSMQLKMQLERTEAILEDEQMQRQKLTAEFEEAQNAACRLQEELEKLRARPLESAEAEAAAQLKERLEKEKKLTSDLGRAATKLQELLKTTQEHLAKEKDTVKKLQEQLDKTEDGSSSKEGTSV